jgi:hypothetical protein
MCPQVASSRPLPLDESPPLEYMYDSQGGFHVMCLQVASSRPLPLDESPPLEYVQTPEQLVKMIQAVRAPPHRMLCI